MDPRAPDHLVTVRGRGYRFVPLAARSSRVALVGRLRERQALIDALRTPGLVVVKGTGGVGKTALAREVADAYRLGPHVVCDLEGVVEPEDVVRRIAVSLQVQSDGDSLGRALAGHGALLVLLDNAEGLVRHPTLLPALAARAPQVRWLATSRRRLGQPGEQVFELLPLREADAVALMRLRAEERGYSVDGDSALRALAVRLDRLPLALELAAARLGSLGPAQLLRTLDRTLDLSATLEWSWRWLDVRARTVLAELSVFAGSFEAENIDEFTGVRAVAQLDELLSASLLTRSLVADGRVRLGLLHTVRRFASDQLAARGDEAVERARRRHAEVYANIATTARGRLQGPDGVEASQRLTIELDNLLAAFEFGVARQLADVAVPSVLGASHVLRMDGAKSVAGRLVDRALGLARLTPRQHAELELMKGRLLGSTDEIVDRLWCAARIAAAARASDIESAAYLAAANTLSVAGRGAEARGLVERARALTPDHPLVAYELAGVHWASEDPTRAVATIRLAARQMRRAGWLRGQAFACANLGHYLFFTGDVAGAEGAYLEARLHFEVVGDRNQTAYMDLALAAVASEHDIQLGQPHNEAFLEWARKAGDRNGIAVSLLNLGAIAFEREEFDEARRHTIEARHVAIEAGLPRLEGQSLWLLTRVYVACANYDEAVRVAERADERLAAVGHLDERVLIRAKRIEALHRAGHPRLAGQLWQELSAQELPAYVLEERSVQQAFRELTALLGPAIRSA
ncbi:MAG: hypothetical protein AAGA48_26290 [Myxococcota bacterium]